jgi:hypothetical protein
MNHPRGHPWLLVAAFLLAGGLFGRAMSTIPSPDSPSVFWIGNLCAPWLVLSFLAGRAQTAWPLALLSGVLTDVACVAGFYLTFLTIAPLTVPLIGHWLQFTAAWFVAAILGGATYGALGHLWHRSHSLAAGLALAAPFIAEPALWPLRTGRYQGPWPIWAAEVVVGATVAALVLVLRRRQPSRLLAS